MRVERILRVSRPVADGARAAGFYRAALRFDEAAPGLIRLGGVEVALVRGPAAKLEGRSDDLAFQHLAIVVRDMDAAYAHLRGVTGWEPISQAGPVLLPPASGGVRAFKFRDPDGNPLELLWFPPGHGRAIWHQAQAELFLGIDHCALSVAATGPSLAFYRDLGFEMAGQTRNGGAAQSLLDGLAVEQLEVTSLRPRAAESPGLELLAYQPPGRPADPTRRRDLLSLVVHDGPPGLRGDPDGHQFVIVPTTAEEASG